MDGNGLKNICAHARLNDNFRAVLQTTRTSQVVLYRLDSKDQVDCIIPSEMHHDASQFIFVVEGNLLVSTWQTEEMRAPTLGSIVRPGMSFLVAEGVTHEVKALDGVVKSYSVYTKPQFPHGLVQKHRPEKM